MKQPPEAKQEFNPTNNPPMEIQPLPIDALNQAFSALDSEYEDLMGALEQAAPSGIRLRPIIAGVEILRAQHRYFFPMKDTFEPTEFPILAEALELEAQWLCDKAATVCVPHPDLAARLLRLAGFSLSLVPHAFEAWLWSHAVEWNGSTRLEESRFDRKAAAIAA